MIAKTTIYPRRAYAIPLTIAKAIAETISNSSINETIRGRHPRLHHHSKAAFMADNRKEPATNKIVSATANKKTSKIFRIIEASWSAGPISHLVLSLVRIAAIDFL